MPIYSLAVSEAEADGRTDRELIAVDGVVMCPLEQCDNRTLDIGRARFDKPAMPDFIEDEGLPFLPHVLKRVFDELVRGCTIWFPEAGLQFSPRAASTLRTLDRLGPLSISEIAETIHQTHPAIIGWVKQLQALGLVETKADSRDRRRTIVSLTEAGLRQAALDRRADAILSDAYRALLEEAGADILAPLWRIEKLNRERPFEERLREAAIEAGWNEGKPSPEG